MAFSVSSITYWSFLCNLLTTVGSFSLSVPQPVHQGETGGAVTLEWLITSPTHISPESVTFHCVCAIPKPVKTFCVNDKYTRYPEHQDEQFRGRVNWEREALQNGALRFHLSNLTTQDSGTYHCIVALGDEEEDGIISLNVTDLGRGAPGPNKGRDFPAPLWVLHGLPLVLFLLLLVITATFVRRKCHHQEEDAVLAEIRLSAIVRPNLVSIPDCLNRLFVIN